MQPFSIAMPKISGASAVMLLTAVALLGLVGLPLLYVLLQAVFPGWSQGELSGAFSLFVPMLSDPELLGLLGNTLRLGIAVVVVCALVAIPLGALRALARIPGGAIWDLLFLIPFMIPPYIAALSWMLTLQPRGYAEQIFGLSASGFLFSFYGIVFVMVLNVFPVVYFAVSRTMMSVGGRYAAAGRVSGATMWRGFWRITLPLATPGIAASLLLVFALTIEEFGTPATLGAQSGYKVLVTGIHERFADWPIDIPGAAVLSLLLVMLAMGAFYFQHWLVTRRSFVSQSGKPTPVERIELGVWTWPVMVFFSLVGLISVGVPILAVLATAFTGTLSGGLTLENLSLRHFEALLANSGGGATGAIHQPEPSYWCGATHRGTWCFSRLPGGTR